MGLDACLSRCRVRDLFLLYIYARHALRSQGRWHIIKYGSFSSFAKEMFLAVFYFIVIGFVVGPVALILEAVLHQPADIPERFKTLWYAPNSLFLIIFLLTGFTIGPVIEEIFFRGFLYNALKSRLHASLAVIVQAAAFSIVHMYGVINSILVFLIGVALALVYERRKNLLSPVLVHCVINTVTLAPLLVLALQNYHTPASTWEEAMRPPEWMKAEPAGDALEKHFDAFTQYTFAVNSYGQVGSRQWKRMLNSLRGVWVYFPDDQVTCARARAEMADVYLTFFRDYRRAVVEADRVITLYPEQEHEVARALAIKGWAYYMLRDFEKSREAFEQVAQDYPGQEAVAARAEEGLEWLSNIDP